MWRWRSEGGRWLLVAVALTARPPDRLTAQSPRAANPERPTVATPAYPVVPAVTVPTGNEDRGLGAGQALGSLVGVYSTDLPAGLHFDLNAGPVGIGAGRPQWFTSVGLARGGPVGVAFELFDFTAGAAGPQQRGLPGAALVTLAEWAVVDVDGALGLTRESPDQLFLGVTTNVGRIFK